MPMEREFKRIDPLHSVAELLVALQLDGHLDGASLPDWAEGTSVEEVFEAVRDLGDGAWLRNLYPDLGVHESCDRWLTAFLRGEAVPTKMDAEQSVMEANGAGVLEEYIQGALVAKESAAFRKALKKPEFKARAELVLLSMSEAVAASFIISDADFKKLGAKDKLLTDEIVADPRLVAMIDYYVANAPAGLFKEMQAAGIPGDAVRGAKRLKAIAAAVKKAAAKSTA